MKKVHSCTWRRDVVPSARRYTHAILAGMTTLDTRTWGPSLYAWLEDYWHEQGITANMWASSHAGIQGGTVSRWRTGDIVPSLPAMVAVAEALDVPVLDVLIAAGVVTQEDVGRDATRAVTPSLDAAIAADPTLEDWQRRNLREFADAMRDVARGSVPVRRKRSVRKAS